MRDLDGLGPRAEGGSSARSSAAGRTLSAEALRDLLAAAAAGDEQGVLALLAGVDPDVPGDAGARSPLRRILDATVTVRAELLWPARRPRCAIWLGPAGGLFAMPAADGAFTVVQAPAAQVTPALARVLVRDDAASPSAAQHARIVTSLERLHRLLALGAGAEAAGVRRALELASLAPQDAAAFTGLAHAGRAHWRAEVCWGANRRRLHAVDCGRAPVWLLGEWPGDLLVGGPSTPAALRRSLSALIPAAANRGDPGR